MFWIAQMGDQSNPKIVGHKMPSSATILARQRKDLVSPLPIILQILCYSTTIDRSQFKSLFPFNKSLHVIKRRYQGKYFVNKAKTERYKQSSIPFMQRLLNKYDANVKKMF